MSDLAFKETLAINSYRFDKENIKAIEQNIWVKNQWPLVYIISEENIAEAYVGESTNAFSRMLNHLSNPDRTKLKTLHLITCDKFNKSATLDIEANLIKYISADGKFKLQNGNAGLATHQYYQQSLYLDIFNNIWQQLKKEKITLQSLQQINNTDLFKYSPYKSLSQDQYLAILNLLKALTFKTENTIFVEGSAGTGKTILAVYLIKLLLTPQREFEADDLESKDKTEYQLIKELKEKYPTPSIALVVPVTPLRATLKKVFKNIKGLNANMVIGPSDVLKKHYDILIVDEAHRLKRRKGIMSYGSFDTNNRKLGLDNNGDELDWILMSSKNQIFFYDAAQSIKPADILPQKFAQIKRKNASPVITLKSQMRVAAGTDYINYIHDLLHCTLTKEQPAFIDETYEFYLFDNFATLVNQLKEKEAAYGLSRLAAGYSWEWKSKHKEAIDIEIDGVSKKWNNTTNDWINTQAAKNLDEIGCIHTTQGYDLNYIGLIFGYEIDYDPILNEIVVDKDKYFDAKGKVGITDPDVLKAYIINIYKTMLFRGIRGAYVYACNPNLRTYLKQHIPNFKS